MAPQPFGEVKLRLLPNQQATELLTGRELGGGEQNAKGTLGGLLCLGRAGGAEASDANFKQFARRPILRATFAAAALTAAAAAGPRAGALLHDFESRLIRNADDEAAAIAALPHLRQPVAPREAVLEANNRHSPRRFFACLHRHSARQRLKRLYPRPRLACNSADNGNLLRGLVGRSGEALQVIV